MSRNRLTGVTWLMALLIGACGAGESSIGLCRIHKPDGVFRIEDQIFVQNDIARKHSDPNSLLFLTHHYSADETQQRAIRLDLSTGRTETQWVTHENAPRSSRAAGYTYFVSGPPGSDRHELIARKTLRFEYLGRKNSMFLPHRNPDGEWSITRNDKFSGTRRIIYKNRPLIEQDVVNYSWLEDIEVFVQIEPDGNRIVCMCTDSKGTWLAVFSRAKLDVDTSAAKPLASVGTQ